MTKTAPKILIIDDDTDIGMMLKMMLEFKEFKAVVTEKVNEAMKIMQTDIIDLILLDMLLSGVNGVDVCMNLKNDPKTKNTPLIMISAHPNAKDLCMNAGADDFIPKPFDMEDIISRINRLLVSQSC